MMTEIRMPRKVDGKISGKIVKNINPAAEQMVLCQDLVQVKMRFSSS